MTSGGITGFSTGVLQSCKNTGPVGYEHVGYNVGGIAGRQSGYLNGCTNQGVILGRKDVGGLRDSWSLKSFCGMAKTS